MSPQQRDDGWLAWGHPSKPIPADGLATSRQRGPMAEMWWSGRFVQVLESYGLGPRLQRGRRYARAGQVLSLDVWPGWISTEVQGTRAQPYRVTVGFKRPNDAQWDQIEASLRSRVGPYAQLLAGEMPRELEDLFEAASVPLFPRRWKDLRPDCSCPDSGNPCKHIAASLYVFADHLDADPWLLLRWRGRTKDELLGHLRTAAAPGAEAQPTHQEAGLPPWWPLRPDDRRAGEVGAPVGWVEGTGPAPGAVGVPEVDPLPPEPPHTALRRLGLLDVEVRGTPAVGLIVPAYEALCAPPDP